MGEFGMKPQRLVIVLTVINLTVLLLNVAQTRSATAQAVAPILRARVLEVVDEHNAVRARLSVKGPNGPIELDLLGKNGGVKLGAGEEGAGLLVADGGTDPSSGAHVQTYVQVLARLIGTAERPTTRIVLKGADGRERVITP